MPIEAQETQILKVEKLQGINDLVSSLKFCAKKKDLQRGTRLHADILKRGLLVKNVYVASALVSMYAKCGALAKAVDVLSDLPVRDICSWNALIAGYVQQGRGEEALRCYEWMQYEGIPSSEVTFISVLRACGSIQEADKGEQIHKEIVGRGFFGKYIVLGNSLVDMYVKCGVLAKAALVFDELPLRDVVSCSTLILGYAEQGQAEEALKCLEWMLFEGLSPNKVTFTCALKACGSTGVVRNGERIHKEIIKQGLLEKDVVVGNSLVDMYAKCGALETAAQVLEELPVRDVVSWSALITGHVQQGQFEEALECFDQMLIEGLDPDRLTFNSVLKVCGNLGAVDKGGQIHNEVKRHGLLGSDIVLGNTLVDMYARCGALTKAVQVFNELTVRDVVSWSALIAGYAKYGHGEEALKCYEQMICDGFCPDVVTCACILKACGEIGVANKGEQIHNEIVRRELAEDIVLGNCLVDMYAKCGALMKATEVLDKLHVQNVVSWNVVIAGYVQWELGVDALKCFSRMQSEEISPDAISFACILKACSIIGATDKGEEIHREIIRQGLLKNEYALSTALVDMYARCGSLEKALQIVDELPVRDGICWSMLIAGHAQQGQGDEVLKCFTQMLYEGISPDTATCICVLTACSHGGLLDEGHRLFVNMSTKYGSVPSPEHHTCMVDLFGRAGEFDSALAILNKIPPSDSFQVWLALLDACREWGNMKLGCLAFNNAIQVNKTTMQLVFK